VIDRRISSNFYAASARVAAPVFIALVIGVSPLLAADLKKTLVDPFVASTKGKLGSRGAEESLRGPVRAILEEIEAQAASDTAELSQRRQESRDARDALVTGLAAEIGTEDGQARAQGLIEKAAKDRRQSRIDSLERQIICWCPDESWTRTLAGCAQGCAEEQKGLIRAWIDEGATDSEVIDRMVAHTKGGPKVRATPEAKGASWIAYLTPGVLSAAGVLIVFLVLRRAKRRGGKSPASRPLEATDEIGEQIER
jgi:cytochrome c-type biogenesis protein CcmH/NrfF